MCRLPAAAPTRTFLDESPAGGRAAAADQSRSLWLSCLSPPCPIVFLSPTHSSSYVAPTLDLLVIATDPSQRPKQCCVMACVILVAHNAQGDVAQIAKQLTFSSFKTCTHIALVQENVFKNSVQYSNLSISCFLSNQHTCIRKLKR